MEGKRERERKSVTKNNTALFYPYLPDEISGPLYDRTGNEQTVLRRSGVGNIERARSRTLKMTLVIGK